MLLVVDANIIFSALVGGNLTELFLSHKLELVAPELLFVEIYKHKEELKQKSHLSEEYFELLLSLLEKRVKTIPLEEYINFFSEAEKMLGEHFKDAPYIALALRLQCPFWSYEKRFRRFKEIESLTTEEVAKVIRQ